MGLPPSAKRWRYRDRTPGPTITLVGASGSCGCKNSARIKDIAVFNNQVLG